MRERVLNTWTVGEYTFIEAEHTWQGELEVLFTYQIEGRKTGDEWYASLDRALISAVGEKYTGIRGAGGTGVGTAADWFARMIGIEEA